MEGQNLKSSTWLNGIFNNPILVLTLGLCPVIGTSTTLKSALFMGVCTLVVLLISNILVSLLRYVIGDKIRIVAYILIIASLVTIIKILTQTFFADIYAQIGNFLSLIVVNCLILGRAESFARKNSVGKAAIDGLSMGLGYLVVISLLGLVREIFGLNTLTLFGVSSVFGANFAPLTILSTTAGGLFCLAFFVMLINAVKLSCKKERSK